MDASRISPFASQLCDKQADYDALLECVGDRSFVLLGEASHGTREFYRMRADITRRLIEELHFDAVAVEADWPDAYRLNRYVRGRGDETGEAAMSDFQRFPEWMWKNHEVRDFIDWLAAFNARRSDLPPAGFYGLDVYSLYRSAAAVIGYLEGVDPDDARRARRRYSCLGHVGDPHSYGMEAAYGMRPSCEDEVVRQLVELQANAASYRSRNGDEAGDEQFFAEQNAIVVRDAETYYRAMFGSRVSSWNLRDQHMAQTLFALRRHLRAAGGSGRIVVWAHNSHLGDARATEMGMRGELNLGQLVREKAGADDALLVGFTTYCGHVSAAHDWDEPVHRMQVREGLPGSCEDLFHRTGLGNFFLRLHGAAAEALRERRLQRAIGVIYRPETERASHHFHVQLPNQFDAVFHIDETEAVEPLDPGEHWIRAEEAEGMVHPTID